MDAFMDSQLFISTFLEVLGRIIVVAGGTCVGVVSAVGLLKWWDGK